MRRRTFMWLSALAAGALNGCGGDASGPAPSPFSRPRLIDGLEALRQAFEANGRHVSAGLLAAVAEEDLRKRCAWFPAPLPDEILGLYAWRGGQANDTWDEPYPFVFRDCGFSSPAMAERSYRAIMDSYGRDPPDDALLRSAFPFAEFNGGWLVVPTRPEGYGGLQRPVISVHQGINVWFHSVNAMVDTCLAWVSDPAWTNEGLPSDRELLIWRKYNPGIFGRA